MSELKVNKVSPSTGTAFTLGDSGDTFTVPSGATITNSGTATGFGGGKMGQVVQTVVSDTTSQAAGGGTTFYDVAGMTVTITPAAASSKILVFVTMEIGSSNNWGATAKMMANVDGGAFADTFIGDTRGNRLRGMFALYEGGTFDQVNYAFQGLHTPSYTLTDDLIYKMQWAVPEAGNTLYLNRDSNDADTTYMSSTCSTITAIEVLA